MKIKLIHSLIALLLCYSAQGQIKLFDLQEINLTDQLFKNAQDIDQKYILELEPDKLLAPYLIDAGITQKESRYGNWESAGLDGHIGGHYLSALAMLYASTGNEVLNDRLKYMVSELAKCQAKNGDGYVGGIPQGKVFWKRIHEGDIDGSNFGLNNTWVPLYNIHKLFAGLYDAYHFTNNQQAKQVLIGLGEWFVNLIEPLSAEQIEQILRTEHGGINESFADLYLLTKNQKFIETAEKMSHKVLLDALLNKEDILTGLHANTQIPKVVGFEKIGRITENQEWIEAARYFWDNVAQKRTVAFGGNSFREHFNPIDDFSGMLESNQGPETCNSYNMLRLSKALYLNSNHSSYVDFYERTLYNHILSSQHPEEGGFVYFTPIRPNHYRVYSQPETSMWCCVGSGIENHTKYGELIYAHSKNELFVNLFISSVLNWKEEEIELVQNTNFPYKNQTELVLNLKENKKFALKIRYPGWAKDLEIMINGERQSLESTPNEYVTIQRIWKSGDKVTVTFNTTTQLESLPDGSNWSAFVNGPIVLAAKTSVDNLVGLFADDSRMGHETKGKLFPIDEGYKLVGRKEDHLSNIKKQDKLRFQLDSLELQPFFEIHDARYQMYFQNLSKEEFEKNNTVNDSDHLEDNIVDEINCGEQQQEADHRYKGEKSESGYDNGKFWRNTLSYISYELTNSGLRSSSLEIQVLDKLNLSNTNITINGKTAEIISTDDRSFRLNIRGIEKIELRISTKNNGLSPRFHKLRIIK